MAACVLCFAACKKDEEKKENVEPQGEEALVLEDFENGGMLEWTGSNGAEFSIVANPYKNSDNSSDFVGKYVTAEAAWDFVWTTAFGGENIAYLNFSSDGYVVKMDVYAPVADMPIYCKLEGTDVEAKEVNTVKTTKANAWETLEFDFEPLGVVDGAYKNFVFCVDAGGTTAGTEVYLDNVRLVKGE